MKKIIIVFLAAVLLLGIGIYYYNVKIAKPAIESVIPANPVFYFHVYNIEKRLNKFKTTKLWRNINKIDVEYLMKKSGAPDEQIAQYHRATSEFFKFISGLLLEKYFGQEVAFALYPNDTHASGPEAVSAVTSNMVIVTRIKPETEFIEFIRKIYAKFDKQTVTRSEKYRKYEITIVEINNNLNIAYVKIKDLLVIGLGKKTVCECLDVLDKVKPALAQDKDFASTRRQLPPAADTMAYLNLQEFFSSIKDLAQASLVAEKGGAAYNSNALQNFNKLEGFKAFGFALTEGKVPKSKFVFTFDKNKIDPLLVKAYSLKPQANTTINFVPKDIIGYQWTVFDPQIYWDSVKKEIVEQRPGDPSMPSAAEVIAGIQNNLGINIENDLIPALGNEVGGMLCDINVSGPFPIPELVFFVKVKNKGALESTLNNLTAKGNLQTRSEDYQKKTINYILLPFGSNLQPAYCFLNDYLLISTSNKPIQDCIDALSDKSKSLLVSKDFQAVNFGLMDKSNSLFFVKTDLFFDKVKKIGEWIIGWASLMSANIDAYQKQAQESLNLAEKQIQEEELKLQNIKVKQEALAAEIAEIKKQGSGQVSDKESELTSLAAQAKAKQDNIDSARKEFSAKQEDFKKATEYFAKRKADPSVVKLYLDEVAYPLLDGLKMIKAIGSVTNFKENVIEATTYYSQE